MTQGQKNTALYNYTALVGVAQDACKVYKHPTSRRFVLSAHYQFKFDTRAMGSGGVGQVKCKSHEIRVQLSAGYGNHNYALCAIIDLKRFS